MKVDFCRLSEMCVGQQGTIIGLYIDQPLRSRMTAMGFQKEAVIRVERKNWFGHVLHIVINQFTNLMIRKADAEHVWVRVEVPVDSN